MREEHPEARSIVDKLQQKGYHAYYAGGWVRDYLLGLPSDDIDIATDAPPEEIQKLFSKTVPIGLSFGIILVIVGGKQFEVATFRKDLEYQDGRRPSKVAWSSAKEDALRRDFTINGMFYNPTDNQVIDYVGGKQDLKEGIVRAIGDAHARIKEDRLRMIRAIRFAYRFDFTIDPDTEMAIRAHAKELFPSTSMERVMQEFTKMTPYPRMKNALLTMFDTGLLQEIFPKLRDLSNRDIEKRIQHLPDFPRRLPTITYLLELFDPLEEKELKELCTYLKVSNEDLNWALFLQKSHSLLHGRAKDDHAWAHFFAHPLHERAISVELARFPITTRDEVYQELLNKKESLKNYIHRIVEKKPVLTSFFLQEKGINPGKEMGDLLKEAEKISVNEKIEDPETIFLKLTRKPHK